MACGETIKKNQGASGFLVQNSNLGALIGIGATIRINWEILCLPYAGFFVFLF